MSHELLYTSAPKGLKSGSRGFCTVMCTRGMPPPLIAALESLSAYRHVYPPGDRNAGKNPVAWSHLTMPVAGRVYHVLSRVADYGLDYSQRGNKLAHHVALEPSEQTAGGPASLLEQPGNMQSNWDGQPRLLPAGRQMRSFSQPPAVCTAWQAMTGDAGWAGVLAESFLANPQQQTYIAFEAGMDLLPLMVEAISLLPRARQWHVTFSTYFTSLPPGLTCAWRCVLSGSPEADQSRKFGRARHINLCGALPAATGGSLVLAARTGSAAPPVSHPPEFTTTDDECTDDEPAIELELSPIEDVGTADADASEEVHSSENASPRLAASGYAVAASPAVPPPLPAVPPRPPGRNRRTLADLNAADAARRANWIRGVAGGLAVLVVALLVAVFAAPRSREWVLKQKSRDRAPNSEIARAASRGDDERDGGSELETNTIEETESTTPGAMQSAESHQAKSGEEADAATRPPSNLPDLETQVDSPNAKDELPEGGKARDASTGKRSETLPSESGDSRETRFRPRIGGHQLSRVPPGEKRSGQFDLFALSLHDTVRNRKSLRLPGLDARTIKLGLRPPQGRSEISVKAKPGDNSELTILKRMPFGDSPRVLTIDAKPGDDGDCEVRFINAHDGWEELRWCLLSVEESDQTLHLFSLQLPALEWNHWQFKDSDFPLPLEDLGQWGSPKTIQIESVALSVTGFDPLHFFHDGQMLNPSLSCKLSPGDAEKILLSDRPQLKLSVNPSRSKSTNGMMLTSLPHVAPLHDCVRNRLKEDLTPIVEWYNSRQNQTSIKSDRLAIDLLSQDKATELQNSAFVKVRQLLKKTAEGLARQIDKATESQNEQQLAPLKQQREEIDGYGQILERLRIASESYRNFRSGLKKADILSLSLHYDFEVPDPKISGARFNVPVPLTFTAPRN